MSKRSVTSPGEAACLAALLALTAGCAATPPVSVPVAPASLQVPATQVLALRGRAVGTQIYQCQATHDDPTRFEWSFKAPEAQLFDAAGKPIIRHYAGPTWESVDGSAVVGEVTARDDGPDAMAIPWLLLRAKSTTGNGVLSHVVSIQRLNTVGGKAPQGGCGAALAGSELRVHYTADYLFYRQRA